jgi:polyribonucleotide 5'-hydroxyl-kinase
VVLGSARLNAELQRRLAMERTSLGEPVAVVNLDKSEGVVERDEVFMQQSREAAIKEYFFGDAKRTLSPLMQQVSFDSVVVYKIPERKSTSSIHRTVHPDKSLSSFRLHGRRRSSREDRSSP